MVEFELLPGFGCAEDLPRFFEPTAPFQMGLVLVLHPEMTEAGFAPVEFVVPLRHISHEEGEVFVPCIVLLSVEEIYAFGVHLLRDVEGIAHSPLVVPEGKDVDCHQ